MTKIYSMVKHIGMNKKIYKNTIDIYKATAEEINVDGVPCYRIVRPDGSKGGTFPVEHVDKLIPLPGKTQLVWGHTMEDLVQYARDNWGM